MAKLFGLLFRLDIALACYAVVCG